MTRKFSWWWSIPLGLLAHSILAKTESLPVPLSASGLVSVSGSQSTAADIPPITRDLLLPFANIAPPPGSFMLAGIQPDQQVAFGIRSDEVAMAASLILEFTPSPALIPVESQVKVYLNDELMGSVSITKEQLGHKNRVEVALEPKFLTDYNRIKLVFVGHYQPLCENPANSTLWLDIGRDSAVKLSLRKLQQADDLAHFPEPFFDHRDDRALTLPFVFADTPSIGEQQAAAVLASWFGAQAQWRGQSFPVHINELPDQNLILFATNQHKPAVLDQHPAFTGPEITLLSKPNNPYVKMLLIGGRDDQDLLMAARGMAMGNLLFRGQRVVVDKVSTLVARKPYDAPNWVRTDRPVLFSELQTYAEQLQANGMSLSPISLTLNLPPDLFMLRKSGIDMHMKYHYTAPHSRDNSKLNIYLNNQFLQSYPLKPDEEQDSQITRLPILQGLLNADTQLTIPALKLGVSNQLRFNFDYSNNLPTGTPGQCETFQLVPNHAVIDGDSTIDFSGFRHYIMMPELRAFANAGFPFSRMADLADTLVLMPKQPSPAQVSSMLNTVGLLGAQTGLAAMQVTFSEDWKQAALQDKDVLSFAGIPADVQQSGQLALQLEKLGNAISLPVQQVNQLNTLMDWHGVTVVQTRADIRANGPLAALIGFESPYHAGRSVLALLAGDHHSYQLLDQALNDAGKRAAMFGSVSIIRDTGVYSLRVGDLYAVGYLPWWERLWFALSGHPFWLAAMSVVSVLLLALVLWRVMRFLAQRRLAHYH